VNLVAAKLLELNLESRAEEADRFHFIFHLLGFFTAQLFLTESLYLEADSLKTLSFVDQELFMGQVA
jgi:hypothetical protein